jgi:hypothetical protein
MGHDGFAFAVPRDECKWKHISQYHPQGNPITGSGCHGFMCNQTSSKTDAFFPTCIMSNLLLGLAGAFIGVGLITFTGQMGAILYVGLCVFAYLLLGKKPSAASSNAATTPTPTKKLYKW